MWGLVAGEKFQLGDTGFEIGKTEWDYAAIILTSLDGKEIVKAKKLLLAKVPWTKLKTITQNL